MEMREGPQTPFEVYCFNCKVTFPVGTRHCVHCGARVASSEQAGLALRIARASKAAAGDSSQVEVSAPGLPSLEFPGEEAEETPSRQSKLSPIARIWIVLALFGALIRICSGG